MRPNEIPEIAHTELINEGYKAYENEEVVVYWNPKICEHAGLCVGNDPETFDVNRRPWIKLDNQTGENIGKVINLCPSGALKYRLKEGK
ncbi:(4Fe-4S)-binding protein [Atopobacter phocae]|uniref:(4Fe-4S)-binding protein n=1 Tax=Atopobacter phocae TaxID=136492 RepID=UPI000470D760|nr:(4Fe-4S)-binding protein [Atopobacter phocae]